MTIEHSIAALDVLVEREAQKSREGWTEKHDNRHERGTLARMAACYAIFGVMDIRVCEALWPFPNWQWFKPKDRRRNLVRAAALLIAEIERMDRVAAIIGEG